MDRFLDKILNFAVSRTSVWCYNISLPMKKRDNKERKHV